MRRTIGAAMLGGAFILSAGPAAAATIAIQNGDFSAGVAQAEGAVGAGHAGGNPTGWAGGSSTGHWNPTPDRFTDEAAHGGVGWSQGTGIANQGHPGMLSQVLAGYTIQANTRYTLTLDVGRWLGGSSSAQPWGFEVGLLGGLLNGTGMIFAELSDATAGVEFSPGLFRTVSMVFETGANDAILGKQLAIVLSGKGPGAAFDNISLDASPVQTSAVPEPATWAMMIIGFGAAGAMVRSSRRRRVLAAA